MWLRSPRPRQERGEDIVISWTFAATLKSRFDYGLLIYPLIKTVRAKELLARSTNTEAGLAERNLDSASCCKRDRRWLSWCEFGLEMGLDMSFLFQSSHYSGTWSPCKVRVSNFVNLCCAVCDWWRLNLQFAVVDCAWQLDQLGKHINRYFWLGLGPCRLDKHLNWQSSRWQGFLVACPWF